MKEAIATLGTALTAEQAALISKFTDNVICAYDNDKAGTKAKLRAVELLSDAGVNVRVLNMENVPEKDPDEFIKAHGGKEFRKLLNKAESAVDFVLRTLKSCPHEEIRVDLTTEEGKKALAEHMSHPMKLLSETEKNLFQVRLFEEYGIITEESRNKIHNGIVFGEGDTPAPKKEVTPKKDNNLGESKDVYDLSPMTNVADLDLPEDVINALGESGVQILAEVKELAPADMKIVFDGDMKMVNQLCDYLGIDIGNRDITD